MTATDEGKTKNVQPQEPDLKGEGSVRCKYCRNGKANSDYEQQSIVSGEWSRLCNRCATTRLNRPIQSPWFRRINASRESTGT